MQGLSPKFQQGVHVTVSSVVAMRQKNAHVLHRPTLILPRLLPLEAQDTSYFAASSVWKASPQCLFMLRIVA